MEEILAHKLDDLKTSVDEVKSDMKTSLGKIEADVKSIKDEAPIHRLTSLEAWKANVNKFMATCAVAVIGAWATVLLTR